MSIKIYQYVRRERNEVKRSNRRDYWGFTFCYMRWFICAYLLKQNTQRIAIAPGETFELNPQDFSTQKIDRLECAGYNVGNLKATPNSPDRYLSFIAQAQPTLSVLLYHFRIDVAIG